MASTEFTTARLGPYHSVPQFPEMKHTILQNGIAIAWCKTGFAAELITSCLNTKDNDD